MTLTGFSPTGTTESYIEISKRGYRKAEPEGGPRETSQVLHKVFAALRAEGITQQVIASS
jgi:hypothetical protein